ncbi:MAG: DNA/RNA nuclease SfsA [Clostridia bacterium]|nr:DNA/RNA nuclease SfsA [Clostridia bacterium]
MTYDNVCRAVFLKRLDRFSALVDRDGSRETVHVKNTGRLGELFVPGAEVWLSRAASPGRKTAYDLVTVRKADGALYNVDSQAPNRAVLEWLREGAWDEMCPEFSYGSSRIDFFMRRGGERYLMEVKGCTLVRDGIGIFPDAPTLRGTKHLRELTRAAGEGFRACAAFVIQTDGVDTVRPNRETDPAFADALEEAEQRGVRILCLPCHVEPDLMRVSLPFRQSLFG